MEDQKVVESAKPRQLRHMAIERLSLGAILSLKLVELVTVDTLEPFGSTS